MNLNKKILIVDGEKGLLDILGLTLQKDESF